MFLHKLLDPEDERRRRVRRARIVRRNRIKREVDQGLPVRKRRVPKASDYALNLDNEVDVEQWTESKTPFKPTFGGNSDNSTQQRQAVSSIHATASPTKSLFSTIGTKSSTSQSALNGSVPSPETASVFPGDVKANSRSMSPHIRDKWRDVFQQVVFQRHDEILAKDPNRKWRQERFGLLLFAKGEFARASEHLSKAITLGATSGLCWRRLAESYYHIWNDGGEWEVLWACQAAYEQALNHVEVACSPVALFTYARVLEWLGSYTGAVTICASILQTFPKFEQLREVKLRFVLLQRHHLFSASTTDPATISTKAAILTKCIGYTQELLLDKAILEGPRHINVFYLHTRLNEMLTDISTTPASQAPGHSPVIQAPKLVHVSVDVLFQELYKLAVKNPEVAPPPGVKWKTWKSRSETYTAFAEYFRALGESILASDSLSRSLELLEATPPESNSSEKSTNLWRGMTEDQRRKRIAVYVVLARNYYQCNQMEKAIRSMEAVFDLDPLHSEARASLVEWFPAKWQYRLELEDASQVQIARVLRGIWDRKRALTRRWKEQRLVENQYRENPYHLGCRRHVLRLLHDKYATLFAAQDLAARSIQRGARRYLFYARMRWKLEEQREKTLRELKSKHQTRKYRYNCQVRAQLAALLPNEYEHRFFREDCSALRIQRCFRGKRTRSDFRRLRDARRQQLQRQSEAVRVIQRFCRRYCRAKANHVPPVDELLFRAQHKLARTKERLALMLQRLYRGWKNAKPRKHSSLFHVFQTEAVEQRQIVLKHTSTLKIQRLWRRYTAGKALGGRVGSQAQTFLVEHFLAAQRRQTFLEVDLDHAARLIQAVYRGKLMRRFLRMLRDRIPAPPSVSPVSTLIAKCETNHHKGVETMATLYSIDNLDEKRALFDHPILVLRGPRTSPDESFSLQHVVSAIQYSAVLKGLICASGDFNDERILTILHALQTRRTLRVLALGEISTIANKRSTNQESNENDHPTRLKSSEWSVSSCDERITGNVPSLSRRLMSLPSPPSSPPPHQKRQLSAMQILSKALCTSNFLLEELYLERNKLLERPQEGAILAGIVADYFFARYGHLHTLVVAHMRFSDANGALLGAALAINTVLQKLDLHGNLLSDGAAIAIANDGLAHNKSLRYLNLAENTLGSAGGKALFRCLDLHNRTLETLILRNNHLMEDVLPSLLEAWQVNAVIESIELAGNLINDHHIAEIQVAAAERREVTSSKDNHELRLLLARKRFGIRGIRSPISKRGIGISASPPSPSVGSGGNTKKKKNAPLSPKKWLSINAPKIISPIAYPTTINRQENEVYPTKTFLVETVYAPLRPRKLLKPTPSPSKLPALPIPTRKKRLVW